MNEGTTQTGRPKKARREWKPLWLTAYREKGTVSAACKVVGVSRSTLYEARGKDEEFAEEWDRAEKETTKLLEDTMFEQAMNGNTTAGIFMLKARRPLIYRESVNVNHGGKVKHEVEIEESVDAAVENLLGENERLRDRLAAVSPNGEAAAAGGPAGEPLAE